MRWSRQYAFKMLIFQSILTGEDMFGYSLSITYGERSNVDKNTGLIFLKNLKTKTWICQQTVISMFYFVLLKYEKNKFNYLYYYYNSYYTQC